MSTSREPIEKTLKNKIPPQLSEMMSIDPPRKGSDIFIRSVKNSTICDALVAGLGLESFSTQSSPLISKSKWLNDYAIRLDGGRVDDLQEHLVKLDSKQCFSEIERVLIRKYPERATKAISACEDGIKRHFPEQTPDSLKNILDDVKSKKSPKTLDDVLALDKQLDALQETYEQCKDELRSGKKSVRDSAADEKSEHTSKVVTTKEKDSTVNETPDKKESLRSPRKS